MLKLDGIKQRVLEIVTAVLVGAPCCAQDTDLRRLPVVDVRAIARPVAAAEFTTSPNARKRPILSVDNSIAIERSSPSKRKAFPSDSSFRGSHEPHPIVRANADDNFEHERYDVGSTLTLNELPAQSNGVEHGEHVVTPQGLPIDSHYDSPWVTGFGHGCNWGAETGHRANLDPDAVPLLDAYQTRVASTPEVSAFLLEESTVPESFRPWWDPFVRRKDKSAVSVDVDWLVRSALVHSSQIQAVTTETYIRRTTLVEEKAQFDLFVYHDQNYDDLNDPIGNTLTTGNNDDRFKDRFWWSKSGVRRRNALGGEIDLGQRFGYQDNNSIFLDPNPQSTSRIELNYTQPLLGGGGRMVNESRIVLAAIDLDSTSDQVVDELQDHLLKVTQAYWDLYRARAEFYQLKKLLQSAQKILKNLEGRQHVDALDRQILRARAAVAQRLSDIARAQTSIRNAQSDLRLLVNDPSLISSPEMFIPLDEPSVTRFPVSMHDGLTTALMHRPDISRAVREIRASTVRLGVSQNLLLPKLDLLFKSYAAGLKGKSDAFGSFADQFSNGRPGFTFGIQFEYPLGNRAARAESERREWELRRSISRFRLTVETALTEVELAVREVHTAYREMVGKFEAMKAADKETRFLHDRWKTLPGVDSTTTELLEDLLDSQERLADEEGSFVQAQVAHSIALVNLRQAMGTLLRHYHGEAPHESGQLGTQGDAPSAVTHDQVEELPEYVEESE